MKIQKIFSKFNLRTISAALCVSLVSSCAYESYPAQSSYGGNSPYSPYGNTRTVSDPTIPLILGASAIGALAYYGKKKHDDRQDSRHYSYRNNGRYSTSYSNYHRNQSRQSNHYSRYTSNNQRNNHISTRPSSNRNHSDRNRNTSREDRSRNSGRDSLDRNRGNQRSNERSRPQTSRPDRTQVVSTGGSRGSRGSSDSDENKTERRSRGRD